MKLAPQVERATIVRGSISGAEIIEAVPVDLHQNFGDLSFFLPASNRARAQDVAIGFAACEFKRF
jgi:hypothetical protein